MNSAITFWDLSFTNKCLSEKVERYADSLLAEDHLKFAQLNKHTKEGAQIVPAVQDTAVYESHLRCRYFIYL